MVWHVERVHGSLLSGSWAYGFGDEFPPVGSQDQPHKGALFKRLDLNKLFMFDGSGGWSEVGGGGPGGGITIAELDGTPSIAADSLFFDQADGFVGTDLGSGDFRLDLFGVPESVLSLNFPTHSSANDPSAGEKAALAGTNGTPGGGNRYVTDSDPRNTDARTPLAHNHAAADVNSGRFSQARMPDAASGFLKAGGVGVDPAYAALGTGDIPTHDIITKHNGFPGGTTNFLRADGSFAAPPGGGGEAFPVGSVFIAVVSTNPGTLLGYGTWAAFAAGRVLVGLDAGQSEFDTVEETGGAKTHTLTESEIPSHTHGVTDAGHTHLTQRYPTATGASSGFTIDTSMSGTLADNTLPVKSATTGITNQNTGGGGAHNNLQPYIVVYMWKRTA